MSRSIRDEGCAIHWELVKAGLDPNANNSIQGLYVALIVSSPPHIVFQLVAGIIPNCRIIFEGAALVLDEKEFCHHIVPHVCNDYVGSIVPDLVWPGLGFDPKAIEIVEIVAQNVDPQLIHSMLRGHQVDIIQILANDLPVEIL